MPLERSQSLDVQNGLAWAIWTYAAQVMGKRRSGVKLTVWLPSTKSRESTSSRCPILECDMALESSRGELQFWLNLVAIGFCSREIWTVKVSGLQPRTISGLQLGSPKKKSHLDVALTESCKEYYMGEGGGFPRVRAVVSLVCPSARGLSQHPRVFPNAN